MKKAFTVLTTAVALAAVSSMAAPKYPFPQNMKHPHGNIIEYADASVFVMDDRDRFSPVTLSGKDPFPQLVVDLLLSDALLFQPFQRSVDRIFLVQAVHETGIDMQSVSGPGFLGDIPAFQYRDDLDAELFRKFVVSFIVSRVRSISDFPAHSLR